MAVDRNDVVGACDHGYACAYMNSMSWKTPTTPLPMETNPRFVFERMFGIGGTAEERLGSKPGGSQHPRWRDAGDRAPARKLGRDDRLKLGEYFDAVRDVEQRIVKAESTNSDFAVPEQPVGVPATFKEYVELMFDLQVLAFQADITRVTSFMMARENVNRSYPEIGLPEAHHSMSHHGNNPEKMAELREAEHLSRRDARLLPEEAAGDSPDGDGTLLDALVVLYGSGMSDGNVQNLRCRSWCWRQDTGHPRQPPHAVSRPPPLSNLMLGMTDRWYGVRMEKFGDSTAAIDLTTL